MIRFYDLLLKMVLGMSIASEWLERVLSDRRNRLVQKTLCPLCDGYGGNWTSELGGHHIGWAQPPEDFDDGVGYAACRCLSE